MTTTTPTSSAVADTVENAVATPDREQPYGALGLKADEYAKIREILGRRPTSGELAMYSSTAHTSPARSTGASSARRSPTT